MPSDKYYSPIESRNTQNSNRNRNNTRAITITLITLISLLVLAGAAYALNLLIKKHNTSSSSITHSCKSSTPTLKTYTNQELPGFSFQYDESFQVSTELSESVNRPLYTARNIYITTPCLSDMKISLFTSVDEMSLGGGEPCISLQEWVSIGNGWHRIDKNVFYRSGPMRGEMRTITYHKAVRHTKVNDNCTLGYTYDDANGIPVNIGAFKIMLVSASVTHDTKNLFDTLVASIQY